MADPLPQQIKDGSVFTRRVEGRGNGLFTSRKLQARSQVLFVARPLMIALETSKLETHCYYCFTPSADKRSPGCEGAKLRACGGCKATWFCDRKCQTRAWKEFHKLECKLFAKLHPRRLPTTVRAVVRLLKQHKEGLVSSDEWNKLLALDSHYTDLLNAGGERWQDAFIMSRGIQGYCETNHSRETIIQLVCIILVNSFTLTDQSFDPLGMALHPLPALMNHSCDPNAFVRFDVRPSTEQKLFPPHGSISVHTLRPILEDEEITISYVDTSCPFAIRQKELKDRYFFDCFCSQCSLGCRSITDLFCNNSQHDTKHSDQCLDIDDESRIVGEQAEKYLHSLQSKGVILHTQVDQITKVLRTLADTGRWPLYRFPCPQLRHELLLGLIANGSYFEALLQSMIIIRAIHPIIYRASLHPLRLMQIWTFINLARVCLETGMLSNDRFLATSIKYPASTVGMLACIFVGDLHQSLHGGPHAGGWVEAAFASAFDEINNSAGAWAAYESNPSRARSDTSRWLDLELSKQLQQEGVSDHVIALSIDIPLFNDLKDGPG